METVIENDVPLAVRMRPLSLDGFVGQEHLVGKGKFLRQLINQKHLPSLILWGPPGSGKTTLAMILSHYFKNDFVFFSAVLSGVKEVRQIVEKAKKKRLENGNSTILFVDEIHRFNKSQQDGFLPHVESGLLTLIGATTENPSFQVIAPLLSRCQVLVLKPLSASDLKTIINNALTNCTNGLGNLGLTIDTDGLARLTGAADGDCRRALNLLETAANLTLANANKEPESGLTITADIIKEAIQHRGLRYDSRGEEHYNLISAFHKSLRDSDPDGAVYWLDRMIASGEDPLYVARRLIRFASEDIGNADPLALQVALNCRDAYHILGSPEGELALFQATTYLATAPKSNALYEAAGKVRGDILKTGSLPVPMHLRNAPTKLMKNCGYGKGYQYAHDSEDGLVLQEHLPPELQGRKYYTPTNRGFEAVILDRLNKWRKILQSRIKLTVKNDTHDAK